GDPTLSSLFGVTDHTLWLGQGAQRDLGYDGDVIYHEFTHAVLETTLHPSFLPLLDRYGVSVAPGAINEGLADYFSSVLTGDPNVGEYAALEASPGDGAIRSLTAADRCPTSIAGESHQDSKFFSTALWDFRRSLASEQQQRELDQAIFAATKASPSGEVTYE